MIKPIFAAAGIALGFAIASYSLGIGPIGASDEQLDLNELVVTVKEEFPDVTHIDTDGVVKLVSKQDGNPVQIIDVREPEEFAVSHLPGAINIPPETEDDALIAAVKPDQPVIVYCSVGYRSSILAQRLQAAGRTNVSNYIGSIFAWANAGQPLQSASGDAKTVHPYDRKWGRYLKPEYRSF
ncbi:rhodanese-like domain-containing protein [Hyphomicrobium sp.]|uniref:rhodanese-like domain-containing protein n=1 Tax=Hyphomicrobium sp. TaxID=82 RepID=UPI003F6E5345